MKKMEETWNIVEDEDACVSREKVDTIIKMMRQKLTTVSNNNQEEFTLRNIFRNFDKN